MSDYAWPERHWPHQDRGCDGVIGAIARGRRRIVLTAPTGMGKSTMMTSLIKYNSDSFGKTSLYTHRRLLLSQIARDFDAAGIDYGIRASGHRPSLLRDTQIGMTQTEGKAVLTHESRTIHDASMVLSDELHAQGGGTLQRLHQMHYDAGASIIGVTATPLDLQGDWDELIVAGTTSEGVRCGALVKAYTYCPDEPDMRHIKNYKIGEDLTDKSNRAAIMRPGVFGRVLKHWKALNPDRKPTILFAPDVAGSIYFAEQFHKEGFRSAHIDAKQIWHRGEYIESSDENRQMILKMVETGEIEVICNRFVLREGINLPMIAHVIFACVFGSLTTYLQAGGRGLRAHHSLDRICCQDHGANFWRHGSLNEDREWKLGMTCAKEAAARMDNLRENGEREPILCAKCGAGRLSGDTCHACGYRSHAKSRKVVQIDGTLQLVEGPTLRPRRRKLKEDTEKKWRSVVHAAGTEKWDTTFLAAEAFFAHKYGYFPPRDLPLMPKDAIGWAGKVRTTPKDELT